MKKFIFAITVLALFLTGCNQKPKPEERFAAYVEEWNELKFDSMYDFLTTEAKENVSKKDFTERYEKIYKDLQIEHLQVQYKVPEELEKAKEDTVELPFSVKMDSVAGEISFDHQAVLVKEKREKEENWYVNWDTTFIFPELEEGDTISLPMTPAKRGEIVDVNGAGLAVNGEVREIGIVPKGMGEDKEKVVAEAAELLGMTPEQIEKNLSASWVQPEHFVPLKKVAADDSELVQTLTALPGVQFRTVAGRVYPLGEAAAHLIGYVGPITAEEMEKTEGYRATDVIGKRGLEQVLEKRLKGEHGVKIVIHKKDGSEVVLAEKEVTDGQQVQLTIDSALQKKIFSELGKEAGTAAAIDPKTGATAALVSSPSFDPNALSLGASASVWKELEDDPNNPLLTRFKATYAPGSVIKPITAAIALEAGAMDWNKTINVKGNSWQKDSSWGSYTVNRVTDPGGPVNLEKALIYSDNIYFAEAALALGKKEFAAGLERFGFEETIPSYLYPLEQSQIGTLDSDIAIADSGYGQGQIEMNILHLAVTYTPFVNGGNMIQPLLEAGEEQVWKDSIMSADTAEKIGAALVKVVEDPNGTARAARIEGYRLAGKTGTAELKGSQEEKGKENGLFVAYNPDHPELLIALMVENVEGRGGSALAVEKVKNIFQK